MRTAQARIVESLAGLTVAACCLVGLAAPVLSAVFGKDDRAALPYALHGLKAKIGALRSTQTGAACTAFCLSVDVIATASHCVFGAPDAAPPDLASLEFQLEGAAPAGVGGRAIGAEAQHIIAGAQRLSLTPPIDAAHDWAAVKLERPACRAGGLPLSNVAPSAAATQGVSHVGVHRDVAPPPALRVSADCPFAVDRETASRDFAEPRAMLLHTCDTGAGSSGSPMLIDRNGQAEVVGLNVGVYVASRAFSSATGSAAPPRRPIANAAISIAALAAAFNELAARDLLTTRQDIARAQRRLIQLGLFEGEPTGRVDDALVAAVRAYERLNNRAETGLLTTKLLGELERGAD